MDLTVVAIPTYFATMGAEYLYLRKRRAQVGPSPADYERRDTVTSLTMGTLSLLAPLALPRLVVPFTPGKGKLGTALLATAAGAAAATTVADVVARRGNDDDPPQSRRARRTRVARAAAKVAGVTAVVAGGVAASAWWRDKTRPEALWKKRVVRDLGRGPLALAAAVIGWDFLYYWNHRLEHEHRALWAVHVVHHSSEHYNLSTALRQPVFETFDMSVPYGLMSLFGIHPVLIEQARGINLLYQYWVHTEAIRTIGPAESVMNTASHHRVHHGRNRQYLDRNHGSIFIIWDKLFGTFEPERERVRYGLTKNINTLDPVQVATHEHRAMLRDVANARSWRNRIGHLVRGPGWQPATSTAVGGGR